MSATGKPVSGTVKGRTQYQKGEEIYMLRSQIREAPYNPRMMGEGQEKRLRKAIEMRPPKSTASCRWVS